MQQAWEYEKEVGEQEQEVREEQVEAVSDYRKHKR